MQNINMSDAVQRRRRSPKHR